MNPSRTTTIGVAALATLTTASVLAGPATAAVHRPAPPTLQAATTIEGRALPRALVTGGWQTKGASRWELDLHAVSVPVGKTTVSSTWRSRTRVIRDGRTMFGSVIGTSHGGLSNGTLTQRESVRICAPGRGCDPWFTNASNDLPRSVVGVFGTYSLTGSAIVVASSGGSIRCYVEWRFIQRQTGADNADTTILIGA